MVLLGCVRAVDGWSEGEVRSLPEPDADRLCAAHPECFLKLARRPSPVVAPPPPPLLTRAT